MKAKRLILPALLALCLLPAWGAELNCTVEINADRVASTSREVFESLRQAIAEYLNTNSFTEAQFAPNEKIECKIMLTVNSYTDNVVTGSLQVQSSRPVYDSSYTSPMLNIRDNDVSFSYSQGDPLTFSRNEITDNLTAILDFYAYLILAVDFDSFSSKGGEACYDEAAKIVQLSRTSGEKGWRAIDDNKNRASLLAALTEAPASAMRDIFYDYHRQGLDRMSVSPDKGRAAITGTLKKLQEIGSAAPMSVALTLFRDTKLDELTGVYSKGGNDERKEVVKILSALYPTETSRIELIANPPK